MNSITFSTLPLFLLLAALTFAAEFDPNYSISGNTQGDRFGHGSIFQSSGQPSNYNNNPIGNQQQQFQQYRPPEETKYPPSNQFQPAGKNTQSQFGNHTWPNEFGQNEFSSGQNTQSADGGVEVEVQLLSYSNPSFVIGPNQLCTCPQGNQRRDWNFKF